MRRYQGLGVPYNSVYSLLGMPCFLAVKGGDASCSDYLGRHCPDDANLSHGLVEVLVASPADEAGHDLIQTEANGLLNGNSVVLAAVMRLSILRGL